MASITVVTDTGGDRTPLLHDSNTEYSIGEVEHTEPPPAEQPPPKITSDPKERLVSLDVFRGLTVALMILVDDAGGAFPDINHAPWFGVTLADFVMPFFLFGVGVSISLVFKKVTNRLEATKKVMSRFIKLFLLGVILQGGYFHGRGDLTYGMDVEKLRVMGVLQRIAIGYMLASALEIWLVNSTITFMKRYSFQIVAGILVGVLYMVLLYGLFVPDWDFDLSSLSMIHPTLLGANLQTVHCGIRGSLEPPCNAVGFIDRVIIGENHLYQRPVYRRTKECSVNSPDYGPPPPNSPAWCLAPFDPEGILSSLMAAITCLVGLHYGHILVHCKDQMQRLIFWLISSLTLLILGYLLTVAGVPLSKPLYTLSYMFITAGVSGVVLTVIYFIVDTRCIQKPTLIFQWMGMNALIVYALAACDIFPAAVQGFYFRSPENNLVDWSERLLQSLFHSEKWDCAKNISTSLSFSLFLSLSSRTLSDWHCRDKMEESGRPSFRSAGGENRLEIVSGRGSYSYNGNPMNRPPESPAVRAVATRPSQAAAKPWGFGDSEMKRRKRIARYKVYTVEGRVKASIRNGLRWIKAKCSEIIHGY